MKPSVRLAVVAAAAALLVAGMFLGMRPINAAITLVSPEVRELSVPCGIGFLPGIPEIPDAAGPGDAVRVPSDPGVALPRAAYAEHCAMATGWSPYLAWGLTALGILGLAVLFAGRGARVGA